MPIERAVLRIALFSDSALPIINGVSVSVDRLKKGLEQLGHQVTLYAPGHPDALQFEPGVVRIPSLVTPLAPRYPFAFTAWSHGKREFMAARHDLVHLHTPFMAGILGQSWARSCGLPLVGSFHTDYRRCLKHCGRPLRWGAAVAAQFVKHSFGACDAVIAPSELSGKWLAEYGCESPQTIVPNGIPHPASLDRRTLRRAMGWQESDLIVLSVGRLAPEKNPLGLVDAFSRVAESCPRAALAVVGDGPWRERVQAAVRAKGLAAHVRMMGERSPAETAACYAASDVFVLASFNETQGLVLGEAMSYGLPVVAAQGGAAATTFTDGREGFAVHPDPDSIADATTSLLVKSSLREKMGQAAKAKGRSWTCLSHAKAIEAVYREVLGHDTMQSVDFVDPGELFPVGRTGEGTE